MIMDNREQKSYKIQLEFNKNCKKLIFYFNELKSTEYMITTSHQTKTTIEHKLKKKTNKYLRT